MLTFIPIPSATTTLELATQDVQTYYNAISPLLIFEGITVAIVCLSILVWAIRAAFHGLKNVMQYKPEDAPWHPSHNDGKDKYFIGKGY